MPPRSKEADVLPSTMRGVKDPLCKAADTFPGSRGASRYGDVLLTLAFRQSQPCALATAA